MKKLKLHSSNGIDTLNVLLWETDNPVGIVQIAHGMIEYAKRYDRFASFLNDKGYIVVANDHLGHGDTAMSDDELGYMNGPSADISIVRDMHRVSVAIKKKYPDLSFFLMGHSMGSFLSRRYAMYYGSELDGLILMGSGEESLINVKLGQLVLMLNTIIFGERHRSRLLELMMLGRYNIRFMNEGSSRSWLSVNKDNQNKSANDKYCSYMFTDKGYRVLLKTVRYIIDKKYVRLIPKDLSVLFVSGADDPVGSFKKGVNKAAARMIKEGVEDVEIIFYDGLRHEILNEDEYELVHDDIYEWIDSHR